MNHRSVPTAYVETKRHVMADRTRAHLVAGGMVGSMRRAGTRVTCECYPDYHSEDGKGGVRFETGPI